MEGIVLELEALVSPWAVLGGASLLAMGISMMLLGRISDEERAGHRLFWAEWPIPGGGEAFYEEEELRRAA